MRASVDTTSPAALSAPLPDRLDVDEAATDVLDDLARPAHRVDERAGEQLDVARLARRPPGVGHQRLDRGVAVDDDVRDVDGVDSVDQRLVASW